MKQTGGHYPAPLEALAVIEEGYGKPVPESLEVEARRIGHIFGGPCKQSPLGSSSDGGDQEGDGRRPSVCGPEAGHARRRAGRGA